MKPKLNNFDAKSKEFADTIKANQQLAKDLSIQSNSILRARTTIRGTITSTTHLSPSTTPLSKMPKEEYTRLVVD
jgi:hypothetical protein